MLKFDNRFENIEHYLWCVYSQLASKFYQDCREHPETEGHKVKELETICPEVYNDFQDIEKFLEYTEKFLGYKYDDESHGFKYLQE